MRSTLTEAIRRRAPGLQWVSERVVQQGHLPAGQICFALLNGRATGVSRMQAE